MQGRIILDNLTALQPFFYQSTIPALTHEFCNTMTRPEYLCSLWISPVLAGLPPDKILPGSCVHITPALSNEGIP